MKNDSKLLSGFGATIGFSDLLINPLKRLVASRLAVAVALLVLVSVSAGCRSDSKNLRQVGPVVTPSGTFSGVQQQASTAAKTVNAFLGIPFAESASGELRWTNPVAKAPLGDFAATSFGPACPQDTSWGGRIKGLRQDEDCLTINVWTPTDPAPAGGFPVMFWIYGGAYLHGATADPLFSGASLAASQSVVVVTANYRIGALGFLAGNVGNATFTGNYALLDQQLALKWTQTNIASFGGNPNNVTLFGESAGAISTGVHLLSVPSSEPLFHAAIIESDPLGISLKTAAEQSITGNAFAKALNCGTSSDAAKCLRGIPIGSLIAAQQGADVMLAVSSATGIGRFTPWGPYLDGTFITQQPIDGAKKGALNKPTILGTVRNEAAVFISALPLSYFEKDSYSQLINGDFGANGAAILAKAAYATTSTAATNKAKYIELTTSRLLTCPTQAAMQFAVASSSIPVYAFWFTHNSKWQANTLFLGIPECGEPNTACHEAELPYVFNTPAAFVDPAGVPSTFTADEAALSSAMQTYWGNFAKNHDPNIGGSTPVVWPRFSVNPKVSNYMVLDTSLTTVNALPDTYECSFWDGLGYDAPKR
ncbi:MAG: carboxylesterase family protein [Smithellaceae bacterium]|nr:carboxylesterase family protein [Smithellaceae bacterium]